jgi:hypothetical protein
MPTKNYAKHKAGASLRNLEMSASGRDIGPIPKVKNPKRKAACERNFRLYCETYHPHSFAMKWSPDHLVIIGQTETAVLTGGLFAMAMPRGTGKTTIAEIACEWASSYGHRQFLTLIGSDEGNALQMLDSIKVEYETNDLLLEDFPEICFPIRALEGIAHRCNGQLHDGQRTNIGWSANEIVLPTVPDSKAAGVIIKVTGLTGGVRGMKFKRPDGKTVRPDLVVVDDPQTDASARSPSQCETRERILSGAILGLAGPGKKIAGIMPCTVIRAGDLADNILDRNKHPDWNGRRTKMVYAFPSNEKLWEEYARIRADGLRAGDSGVAATKFYRKNRKEMDLGAVVAWPERFNYDEISAIQNAMNLKLRDERAFFAEYQNEPQAEEDARSDDLSPDQILSKINGIPRGEIPLSCSRITSFIDVHGSLLYWVVVAWEDAFTGYIVDYGTFPDQKRPYFTLRDAKATMETAYPKMGLEGRLHAGLTATTDHLLGRDWIRDDGASLKIERCLIDANWGSSTDAIYQWCRQSPFSGVVMPSHGKYVGAASAPMRDYKNKPGDKAGLNWRMPNVQGKRAVRYALFDTNYWKSFVHARLSVAMGDRGCLSLFGAKPDAHRLFADHLVAEFRVRTEGRGRTVDEWKLRPDRPDNHWLDCVVGNAVAASIQGVSLAETTQAPLPRPKKVSFAEMQRQKNA